MPNPDRQFSRRIAITTALTAAMHPAITWADNSPVTQEIDALPAGVAPRVVAATRKGLNWLSSRQMNDGGFGESRFYARNVGVCGLCGFAFLAHQGGQGPLARQLVGCADYLLRCARANGFIVEDDVVTHGPMYGHGFATMFLGQWYGFDQRPQTRLALKRATDLIIAAQEPHGGWRYTADPDDADVSVTACQMMALLSARQAGIGVPKTVIDRAVDFILACQDSDGGFRYRPGDPPVSSFPRSAAAVVALCACGQSRHPAVHEARRYLSRPITVPAASHGEYFYYGRMYGTHAAWQGDRESWDRWFPGVCDELLNRQQDDGRWRDPNIGDEYATAMALISLQLPYGIVPLFSGDL